MLLQLVALGVLTEKHFRSYDDRLRTQLPDVVGARFDAGGGIHGYLRVP